MLINRCLLRRPDADKNVLLPIRYPVMILQILPEGLHTEVLAWSELKNPFKDLPLFPLQFTSLSRFTHGTKIPQSWKAPDKTYTFELVGNSFGYPVEIRSENNATTSFILEYE